MDTIEITLPVSGKKVEIRNYTTEADDEKSESVLYLGVNAEQDMIKGKGDSQKLTFPIANVMASKKAYVPRLVTSIDGDNSNIALRLKELRSADYAYLSNEVERIVEENSPKVNEARKASNKTTPSS